jgi:hypothetical protein
VTPSTIYDRMKMALENLVEPSLSISRDEHDDFAVGLMYVTNGETKHAIGYASTLAGALDESLKEAGW